MFSQRQYYFSRLARSHPILKFINVYDRQSFIRQYVLDNIFICVFAYVLFYLTLWYANRVIKKIDKSNKELLEIVEDNKTKLADVIVLKDERQEYQEVVMKARGIQQATSLWLENEINRLNNELSVTADKLTSLEKILKKRMLREKPESCQVDRLTGKDKCPEGTDFVTDSLENVKILQPSFSKTPTQQKYGISVSRPSKFRTPLPKIGFK
ncbi:uncharacterized protein [Chelonus insularis]|uniref:uncharacterized protein isoform X2 n=1 Tax=Chelonus insularis TaxID=460826 RepID=UPI00158C75B3|nr:uncharacterized protein LOC118070271 isoform X2 [Chelonus insularis]